MSSGAPDSQQHLEFPLVERVAQWNASAISALRAGALALAALIAGSIGAVALALLDGYRHDRFHAVADPATVTRGLVVYSFLDGHRAPPTAPPGRRVFATATSGGRRWVEVYAVGVPGDAPPR